VLSVWCLAVVMTVAVAVAVADEHTSRPIFVFPCAAVQHARSGGVQTAAVVHSKQNSYTHLYTSAAGNLCSKLQQQ
jgi:hypothetical protein